MSLLLCCAKPSKDKEEMEEIVRTKTRQRLQDIPQVSLADYLLDKLKAGVDKYGHKDFIVDVNSGTSVKFRDLESQSRRVASALARKGFKKDDVLYFATYELAQLFVTHFAVWRLGGALRGCYQAMPPAEYARQISETKTRFLLVDAETAPLFHEAAKLLSWPVEMMSVGNQPAPGATSFQEMLQDDGSACPAKVEVDLKNDVVMISNTSGSTGVPKGCLHTHSSAVAFLCAGEHVLPKSSFIHTMMSNGIGTFGYGIHAICTGLTTFYTGKFAKETFFDILMKYKPEHVMLYPFVATWFARCELDLSRMRDANFLRSIIVGGWMLDPMTNELLQKHLPRTTIRQMYGSSELILVSVTDDSKTGEIKRLKVAKDSGGQELFSNGNLLPLIEAKTVDPATKATLPRGHEGEILFRTPIMMKGYHVPGEVPNREPIDSEGWYHTGDLGFFDEEGHMYVKERVIFTYKYCMQRISPNEIEAVIAEHPAVLAAGVVGIPNADTDCETRAFVSLRPGCQATEQEIVDFVASKAPKHKHIHAGVVFLPALPVNRGLKLDRAALRKMALEGIKK